MSMFPLFVHQPKLSRRHLRAGCLQKGLTLIEVMVALAISVIVIMAVTTMILVSQTHERVTSSANDMSQTGAFVSSTLDSAIRGAGAGFSQYWNRGAMGCIISARRNGSIVLPRGWGQPLPVPFDNVMGGVGQFKLAPVIIAKGQSSADDEDEGASDVLIVMGSRSNIGDIPRAARSYSGGETGWSESGAQIVNSAGMLYLDNTVSIKQNDLLLVSRPGFINCILTQVDSGNSSLPFKDQPAQMAVPLGGSFFNEAAEHNMVTLGGLVSHSAGDAMVTSLGSADDVQMQLLGVGPDKVLYRYDLLQSSGADEPQAIAEGVVLMRAEYQAIHNMDDASITTWSPSSQTPSGEAYGYSALLNQTPPANLRTIAAVRVAFLLRSNVRQSEKVAQASYVLLNGGAAAATVTLDEADRHYAHRVFETTIPLRSMMMRLLPPEELS